MTDISNAAIEAVARAMMFPTITSGKPPEYWLNKAKAALETAAPFMLEEQLVNSKTLQESAWQLGWNSGRIDGIDAAAHCLVDMKPSYMTTEQTKKKYMDAILALKTEVK